MKFQLKYAPADAPAGQSSAQAQVQSSVSNIKKGAECRRKLQSASYASNSNVVIDIPRDTSIKRINLNLVGAFTVTYASGSPTLSPLGVFAKLVPNYYVVADGSRNIKVLDLFMQRCMNAIAYSGVPRRAYAKGASLASTNDFPSTEWLSASIAYPDTTQDFVVSDNVVIDFENVFAYEQGRNISQLYTRNLQTCNMTFGFADISLLQTDGVGASVTYSNVSISITPTIIENRQGTLAEGAYDFNEFVLRKSFSSAQNLAQFDLNAGNKIVGFGIFTRNGASSLAPADNIATTLQLLTNGVNPIQVTTFRDLQADNKIRYAVSDDQYASSLHALSGFAYMGLLKNGDALSGLDTSLADGVSTVQMQVSTGPSSGLDSVTYTNNIQVSILQQQLVPVPVKS